MKEKEAPQTDSGYPTPRDDLPSSSRSESPPRTPENLPLTSTPVRSAHRRPMKDHFADFRHNLSMIDSETSANNTSETVNPVIEGVKNFLIVSKELKQKSRANAALRDENETLRGENESLREENCTLREESRRFEGHGHDETDGVPKIPRLVFDSAENVEEPPGGNAKFGEKIKKELLSFIKNEEERSLVESKIDHMLHTDQNHPKIYTATTTIKMDADVQTDDKEENHVNVINANLQIELDQLQSELETREKNTEELKNRLFDFEKLKAKFEENETKLREDLEKKLKKSQEKVGKCETRIEELELRLKNKRQELEEVSAENKRLAEDRATHDFELDEMRMHVKEVERKMVEAEEKIEKLIGECAEIKKNLEKEQELVKKLEETSENLKNDHQKELENLQKSSESALRKESEALEQLAKIQDENQKILKENQYLSEANQVLIDKEINLKGSVSEVNAKLRNAETQLEQLTQKLSEEEKKRKSAEADVFNLELLNQELEDDKRDKNEILEELKKSKKEIDYLREQLQIAMTGGDDMKRLKNELVEERRRILEIEELLSVGEQQKQELGEKIEVLIRSEAVKIAEVQRLREQEAQLKSLIDELKGGETLNKELQKHLEHVQNEFDEFKEHATMQYNDQIGIRDQQIKDLHERLVQLESYPGQTISVSKKSAEVQTELEKAPEVEKSPPVSLRSEKIVPAPQTSKIEQHIQKLIEKLLEFSEGRRISDLSSSRRRDPPDNYQCSETFMLVAEIFQQLLDSERDSPPTELIVEFWDSLERRIRMMNSVADERTFDKIQAVKRDYQDEVRELQNHLRKAQEELSQEQQLSQERFQVANEFRQHYELECRDREIEVKSYQKEINGLITEMNEREAATDVVVARLEQSQKNEESLRRARIEDREQVDAQISQLDRALKKTREELDAQKAKFFAETQELRKKRAFDKESMKKMKASFDTVMDKMEYLRTRNTQRQKLLNHMQQVMHEVVRQNQPSGSQRCLVELHNDLNRSNLVELIPRERGSPVVIGGDDSIDNGPDPSSPRRVLVNINRSLGS